MIEGSALILESRPYQERIIAQAVQHFLGDELRSVLIESPTGSGKTVMGLLIASQLQKRQRLKVGWVAMRRNLLAQAAAENESKGLGVDCHFFSMFDKNPPPGLDLLVVDEAQHDATDSMAHIHNVVQPRFILGLTATPFRADRAKLCFDTVIRDAGIHRLIQDGYLSRFWHYTLPRHAPDTLVDCYVRDPRRWGKSIFYFHTLRHAHAAHQLLAARGVRSDVVTGDSDREAQIEAFRDGRLSVLVNCQVLAEGFDCPDLATVFCRPSGRGATVQMCGRVLRQHPDVPFKQIVQCQETRWPFSRTATPDQSLVWMNDSWRSLTVNPHVQQLNQRTLQALAKIEVQLPKCLVAAKPGRRSRRRRVPRR